ncbi:MAG TPA: hypothetical protein VN643_22145 [Pyrinomonadaceae bacterium]|nr:hypothetical protein [Pyrinomonadaceae bacterium]
MGFHEPKAALVIAHPGHELRVYHWLETTRPLVFVLTDGSGRSGISRLSSTTRLLDRVGARAGSIYGRITDADAYSALLERDFEKFTSLARELASQLRDREIELVAGDALEGYNPTHDVCRLIINTAVNLANKSGGRQIGNFDFPLTGAPDVADQNGCVKLQLDDEAFQRKMSAARGYAELDAEVDAAIRKNRLEAFKSECLRPVIATEAVDLNEKPYYERYGEEQVAAGHYSHVIRYREHFGPLVEAMAQIDREVARASCP